MLIFKFDYTNVYKMKLIENCLFIFMITYKDNTGNGFKLLLLDGSEQDVYLSSEKK